MKLSTGLRNYMLSNQSLKDALDDGIISIYAGPPPATADAALDIGGDHTLLCVITDNDQGIGAGQGIDFDTAAVDGVLSKAPAQVWSGTNVDTGVATFFRYTAQADDGTLSTSQVRIQGTVAEGGGDMNMASTSLADTVLQPIDFFSVALPTL